MKYVSIPAIVMASSVMMLSAQSVSQKQIKPDYIALNECIGAKVSMNPGAEALGKAAEKKETAARPAGEISDILIATKTGQAEWAVVSFGGVLGIGDKTIAMPCAVLQWNPATKCYDANVSHDHVKALNAFDAKKAKAQGLDDAMTAFATNWRFVVTATTLEKSVEEANAAKAALNEKRADKAVVAIAGTTMVAIPRLLMCASEVDDYALYARGEDFGTVSNCVFDRANSTLVFVIVGHGGVLGIGKDEYLLPFTALRLAKKDDATVLVVDKSAAEMTAGVKYVKPAQGIVDAEAAARCCATVGAKATIGG